MTGRKNECESGRDKTNMLILTYGTNLTHTDIYQTLDSLTHTKLDLVCSNIDVINNRNLFLT